MDNRRKRQRTRCVEERRVRVGEDEQEQTSGRGQSEMGLDENWN